MILVFGSLLVCGVAASSDMTAIPMWLLHQYYDNEDANCAASSPNEELEEPFNYCIVTEAAEAVSQMYLNATATTYQYCIYTDMKCSMGQQCVTRQLGCQIEQDTGYNTTSKISVVPLLSLRQLTPSPVPVAGVLTLTVYPFSNCTDVGSAFASKSLPFNIRSCPMGVKYSGDYMAPSGGLAGGWTRFCQYFDPACTQQLLYCETYQAGSVCVPQASGMSYRVSVQNQMMPAKGSALVPFGALVATAVLAIALW